MLCEMEKQTTWHFETQRWVIAEKLGGGPFIVSKTHQKALSDEEWQEMERMIRLAGFEEYDIAVRMNMVENHFHAHILTPGSSADLSDE